MANEIISVGAAVTASFPTTTSSPAPQGKTDNATTKPPLPPVTRGSSDDYLVRASLATARASTDYAFTILLEKEKISHATSVPISDVVIEDATVVENARVAALARLRKKVAWGSFVVEAGGFAAISCWEPRSILDDEYTSGQQALVESIRTSRPLFAAFLEEEDELRRRHLEPAVRRMRPADGRFWNMSLVARDPTVPYVPGAVRAVIAPLMDEFCSGDTEGGAVPIWLVAGGQKARDMYEHFGFRDVGCLHIAGLPLWAMLYTAGLDE
ncbi:hypothetical protein Micbo1qcDRAFT_212338 [Microdochium bolleyi]|uniref:N-acetyltransferase domain-containing protein n=1 Tax=Microdochium bolleyi TaxID=196109 RepID=A0A136IXZ5_9PEZI|nr:hypothetical protein Micbo1qcDRAFT_212338 [Microdochium bolleyi]